MMYPVSSHNDGPCQVHNDGPCQVYNDGPLYVHNDGPCQVHNYGPCRLHKDERSLGSVKRGFVHEPRPPSTTSTTVARNLARADSGQSDSVRSGSGSARLNVKGGSDDGFYLNISD